jgi:carboxymethylenebutenolidase
MPGQMIEFSSNGATTPGYLVVPAGGPHPGLVLIQEWWGLVDHIRDLADRFAAQGFAVLAPDLFHGETTKSPDTAGKLLMALDIPRAAKEIRAAGDHLAGMDTVSPDRVGVVGFCMGGQLALYAGQEYPERFGAVVDFYGIHPNATVEPERIRIPVMMHFAKRDKSVPLDSARDFVDRVNRDKPTVEAHYYEADHAFFNDTRPEVYSPDEASKAWSRTLEFLRTNLGSGP